MPVQIYCSSDEENPFDPVGSVAESDWDLPVQIDELEQWLSMHCKELTKGSYIADIGFTMREDACGGGAVMSKSLITMLHEIDMEVYFSEYGLSDPEPG